MKIDVGNKVYRKDGAIGVFTVMATEENPNYMLLPGFQYVIQKEGAVALINVMENEIGLL